MKLLKNLYISRYISVQGNIDGSDEEVHKFVKAADKLAAYIKCIEEIKRGPNLLSKNSLYKDLIQ